MTSGLRVGLAGLLAIAIASPVLAHHGWAGNAAEDFTLSGTVEQSVNLGGPHATMTIKSADGQVWNLTLAPGPRTERAGLKSGMIPVGEKVTIVGHRNRDPKRFEVKTEKVTWNGRTFEVYADRH